MLFHNGAVLHPWLVLVQSYNVLYHLSSSDRHRRENHHEEGLYRFDSRTIEVPCATCKFYHTILFFSLSWFSRAGRCPLNNKMRCLDNTNWEYERRVCPHTKLRYKNCITYRLFEWNQITEKPLLRPLSLAFLLKIPLSPPPTAPWRK